MIDQFSELMHFSKGIIRNKWLVTCVACVICIIGWSYIYKMPNKYQSTARVYVDTRTMLRPLLKGLAVQPNVSQLVGVMKKLMFTQKNMINIAKLGGLNVDFSSEEQARKLVADLKKKLKIKGGKDDIFTIDYESASPQQAKNIVQAVLAVFSEQTQQSSLKDAETAQKFIESQIREYEQRLRNAERARENFKRENIGLLPGQDGEGQISVIQDIRRNIAEVKLQLTEFLSKKRVLKKQLNEALETSKKWELSGGGAVSNTPEDTLIVKLVDRKNDLLLRYTDNHPNISAINNEIAALQKRKAENEKLYGSSVKVMSNPYVQTIKVELNSIDTEVASLNSRLYTFNKRLKTENDQLNARLVIETEMQNLNRDYDSIKKNYMSLLDRREQARMSTNVDSEVSALKFKIADAPTLPFEPASPQRPILYTAVLLFGIVLGVGLAILKVFLRPSFSEAKQLRNITGVTVLGTVSEVVNDAQSKQNFYRLIRYASVNFLLLLGYSGFMLSDVLF